MREQLGAISRSKLLAASLLASGAVMLVVASASEEQGMPRRSASISHSSQIEGIVGGGLDGGAFGIMLAIRLAGQRQPLVEAAPADEVVATAPPLPLPPNVVAIQAGCAA